MDPLTVQYYDDNAEAVFARYQVAISSVTRYFKLAFPQRSEILDIGAGSGRDMQTLIREEYEAYGVEPSEVLRRLAVEHNPQLSERLQVGSLPGLAAQIGKKFDGILCSAVFMHIPEDLHFDSAFDIRNLLKPHGRLLLSIPRNRPDLNKDCRDRDGRLFVPLIPGSLQLLFERLGFQLIGRWEDEDGLGRPGLSWTTLLFELSAGGSVRPIDQVEGVLNRDKKDATYKLALFRALCDIALTNFRLAEWRPDGFVGISIREIAERWIYYYWPLLEDDLNFIRQRRSESRGGKGPIGFRPHLEQLIAAFRPLGGLDVFAVAFIALCKLHHSACDAHILGVRPDPTVEIRKDIMEESDGPVHVYGLKGCHNKPLVAIPRSPSLKPRKDFLEERYELFRKAG